MFLSVCVVCFGFAMIENVQAWVVRCQSVKVNDARKMVAALLGF